MARAELTDKSQGLAGGFITSESGGESQQSGDPCPPIVLRKQTSSYNTTEHLSSKCIKNRVNTRGQGRAVPPELEVSEGHQRMTCWGENHGSQRHIKCTCQTFYLTNE